jgi:hypothetical protein
VIQKIVGASRFSAAADHARSQEFLAAPCHPSKINAADQYRGCPPNAIAVQVLTAIVID